MSEEEIETSDGERLQAYMFLRPRASDVPTVLFFHGNAGNLSYRLPNIRGMYEHLACNVVIVSYRGYGRSTGVPSETGLKKDASAALRWLRGRQEIDRSRIVVFGRSLGGAVALDLAAKSGADIAGVIVENTFTSIPDMARTIIPLAGLFFPASLCRNRWESIQTVNNVLVPILFVSGQKDELVPKAMMEALYKSCRSPHKQIVRFPRGNHNNTSLLPGYYDQLRTFIDRLETFS